MRTNLRLSVFTGLSTVMLLSLTEFSHAHSTERGLVLLLPTELYLMGGALTVLASFVLLAIVPASAVQKLFNGTLKMFSGIPVSGTVTSLLSFAFLMILVVAGMTGPTDPLVNPLPVTTWTIWWVVFTLVQCLTGDLWKYLNPWTGIGRLTRRGLGLKEPLLILPDKAGYGAAIILFAGFAWFELVDIAPEDPTRLGWAVLIYWLVNYVAVVVFGERQWFERGEPFSIFFRLVGNLSPFRRISAADGTLEIRLGFPGSSLASLPPLPLSGVLFVLLTLATVSFDGLSRTFVWLEQIGVNPLAYPGRSGVMTENSLGLFLATVVLGVLYLSSIYAGCALAGNRSSFSEAAARLVYSIIPISLVFHAAHYLTQLLVMSQYAVLAFNDPFGTGVNLLGAGHFHVTTSFLNDLESVSSIWIFQTIAIVSGHVIGITMAHIISLQIFGHVRSAVMSQVFLAGLMVAYTLFGLWLLSTPAIG